MRGETVEDGAAIVARRAESRVAGESKNSVYCGRKDLGSRDAFEWAVVELRDLVE
jgi:hypothetical protein